jgi:hypothetical protein
MSKEHLETYLNDHLAGSVVALEMLEKLEEEHRDTDLGQFASGLKADVASDRQQLELVMEQLQLSEHSTRKAAAWLTEKFTELKLRWDDAGDRSLRWLETFEALSLGIEGKRSLWLALRWAAEETPALQLADYDKLIARAEDQRGRVEQMRLNSARTALKIE